MLPRRHRLANRSDILAVLRTGRQYKSAAATAYVKPAAAWRVACVVGKKVSPLATVRHRYQRWLRVIARDLVFTRPPADLVLVARPGIKDCPSLAAVRQAVVKSLPAAYHS